MPTDESSTVLTKEELDAAIAEVEALAPGEGSVPNLDDGAGSETVPIPVPALGRQQGLAADSAKPAPAATGRLAAVAAGGPPSGATPAADGGATGEKNVARAPPAGIIRRLLGWLPLFGVRSGSSPPSEASGAADSRRASPVYRVIDVTLDLINRPFIGLSADARRIVGIVGIVTLVTSLLSAALWPLLIPRKDALTFLHDKRVEVLMAPADETSEPSP